jgi:hypothetical protein
MHPVPYLKLAGLLIAAIGLVSCAQTTGSYRAPTFHPGVLAVRGVRIGTIHSEAPGPNLGGRDQGELLALLGKELAKGNKILVSQSSNSLILNATLTRNDIDRWVANDCRQVQEPVYDEDGKVTGYIVTDVHVTVANSRRSLEGAFELIEPTSGRVEWAWSGASSQECSNSNESPFFNPPPPLFPEPPGTSAVASTLVRTAVRKLTAKN